jgi:hypothetical protein
MPMIKTRVSALSAKAQKLGLLTREDVEKEFVAAKSGWSKGSLYHCPFCDVDLWSPSGARKHMKTQDHPVLRWDWY